MKLTFLGTAAAEGIPCMWCRCEACNIAREQGGKNIRRRCSYLIDDDTIIDLGPDFYQQMIDYRINAPELRRVLFTHPHADHMASDYFIYRRSPAFCSFVPDWKMDVLLSSQTLRTFAGNIFNVVGGGVDVRDVWSDLRVNPSVLDPGKWCASGDMEVMGIPASHANGLGAMILAIRRNGKTLLIGNDTGMLCDESWDMLKGVKFDCAVIECTLGTKRPTQGKNHLGATQTKDFRRKLIELGCITMDTPVYTNHFSHNGCVSHDDLEQAFAPDRIVVAYDGLEIEF